MTGKKGVAILPATVAILFSVIPLHASIDRGAVNGTIRDAQGAVVPGARVVIVNIATNVEVRLITNADGFYLAAELVPGRYSVRVEAAGVAQHQNRGFCDMERFSAL